MWKLQWPEWFRQWAACRETAFWALLNDALSMSLLVAVSVLATLAYGR